MSDLDLGPAIDHMPNCELALISIPATPSAGQSIISGRIIDEQTNAVFIPQGVSRGTCSYGDHDYVERLRWVATKAARRPWLIPRFRGPPCTRKIRR